MDFVWLASLTVCFGVSFLLLDGIARLQTEK
jgi:hypothetical protein